MNTEEFISKWLDIKEWDSEIIKEIKRLADIGNNFEKYTEVGFNSIELNRNHNILKTQESVVCEKCKVSLYEGSNQEDMQDYFEILKTGKFYCSKCFAELLIKSDGLLDTVIKLD